MVVVWSVLVECFIVSQTPAMRHRAVERLSVSSPEVAAAAS